MLLQPLLHRRAATLDAERRTHHMVGRRLHARFSMRPQIAFNASIRPRKTRWPTYVQDAPVPHREQLAHHLVGAASLSDSMFTTPLIGHSPCTDTIGVC